MKRLLAAVGLVLVFGAPSRADYGWGCSVEASVPVNTADDYYCVLTWSAPSTALTSLRITISAPDGTVSVVDASKAWGTINSNGSGNIHFDGSFTPTQVGTYTLTFTGCDGNGVAQYGHSTYITVTPPSSGGGGGA